MYAAWSRQCVWHVPLAVYIHLYMLEPQHKRENSCCVIILTSIAPLPTSDARTPLKPRTWELQFKACLVEQKHMKTTGHVLFLDHVLQPVRMSHSSEAKHI